MGDLPALEEFRIYTVNKHLVCPISLPVSWGVFHSRRDMWQVEDTVFHGNFVTFFHTYRGSVIWPLYDQLFDTVSQPRRHYDYFLTAHR